MSRVKRVFVFVVTAFVCFGLFRPATAVYANMAQPMEDRGSGVLFDKHESVKVDSEILNIKLNKSPAAMSSGYRRATADISATYKMTNISDERVVVKAMFLSPVYSDAVNEYFITVDGVTLDYTTEFFSRGYNYLKESDLLNWESILAEGDTDEDEYSGYIYVSAVNYSFEFEPHQTLELSVSYIYNTNINTYQQSDRTVLRYFLTPAKYWQDFGDLTINLTLHDEHPTLIASSLEFTKISRGVYKYESQGIPRTELVITAGADSTVGIVVAIAVVFVCVVAFFTLRYLKKRRNSDR